MYPGKEMSKNKLPAKGADTSIFISEMTGGEIKKVLIVNFNYGRFL